ncbi:neuronal acetylcholine receptor subunit alpha-5-like [Temnothorax curvispinosus]|uniref:Neuronal acetylcholine receptor subunit alpha-5-like n=1 Tax=Temnothorax curvispinosus TaxID=300111 RepID=A0A6J1QM99_9HYME|nr:neuronal acetylcholine receptor subunit alpha-5-like [Temnothorax curvispinosus]
MRILNVFGFFGILCINFEQFTAFNNKMDIRSGINGFDGYKVSDLDIVKRNCKNLETLSPLLRLKKHLFCDYDDTVYPNYPKTTNVTLILMPRQMNFKTDNAKLLLHSWMSLTWMDPRLTWTPSDYDDITFIHVKSWEIWTPDLCLNNSADMSSDQYGLPTTECLLFNSGSVSCVPVVKFISKCDPDYTYWPYDKHQCRVTFISWMHKGEEVDLLMSGIGIIMSSYINDTRWDFKFINSMREVKKYKCCPNDTYPKINYNFLLTRHHGKHHSSIIIPAIALMLLTLIVLCLDLKSVERMAVASVNFVCHFLCMYVVHWSIPYNRTNPPNILLFYRESLALATFAIILTALLRKLEDMSTEIPNWISFTTAFVLNNKAGRFLILKDDESNCKIIDRDIVTEENLDAPKSEISTKESSWKYFAAIIDWLSFFCVILTYVIVLIILVPAG